MFEWLKDYQRLEQEIAYLEFNLEQTEAELNRWVNGDLVGVRLSADSIGAKVEENIEQIKSTLAFKREQMLKLIALVQTFKGLDNQILKMKYISGFTLEEIAEELNYSESHIRKRHADLMRTIRFVEDYCS